MTNWQKEKQAIVVDTQMIQILELRGREFKYD